MTDASLPPDSDVLAKAKELRERVLNNGLVPVVHDPLLEDDDPIVDAVMRVVDGLIEEVERLRAEGERLKTRMRAEGLHVPGDRHSAYADPIRGGFDGYQAACWDCDWRSPTIHNDKGIAQDEARAHWELTDG